MKVKPDPYIISFHVDADGGPQHLLHMLKGYGVSLKKDGKVVGEGIVTEVNDDIVTIAQFCDCCNQTNYDKPKDFDMLNDFNEVMYL